MSSSVVASPVWLCVALALALAAPQIPASAVGPPPPPCSCGGNECHRCCGDVYVPYPFGFDTGPDDTSMAPGFHLSCNDTGNGVFKLYTGNVEVVNISLPQGLMLVLNHISYSCYDGTGKKVASDNWQFQLSEKYSFSGTWNRFTVIGCRTLAYISGDTTGHGSVEDGYQTGCVAMCGHGNLGRLSNGSCRGTGCCQTNIPPDLRYYKVSFDDHIKPSEFNATSPCSYAVLLERDRFKFQTAYLTPNEFNKSNNGQVPVLLDWVVGNETCRVARTKPGYACVSSNSECVDAPSGYGYFCNCIKGYQGNPYLKDPGCTDIDECKENQTYPCYGTCYNKPGTYECFCPLGTHGNASIQECQQVPSPFGLGARLAIGIPGGLLVAVIAFLAVVLLHHKRRLRRQAHFHHNGGQLLKRMLLVDGNNSFTIYDSGDIVKATRNFHKTTILGEGAHGTVYKATLRVGGGATVTVAVKRCKVIDESRKKEFVQELVILCRLRHPNVVRLLGCCLECEAPMLVYEFVPNKSLNHLLHGKPMRPVTLATRLRIAAETAEALAHLHSSSRPVLHGDVKPENILLADGLTAKVSDFGCSTINHNVQVVPKGTLAYLDPEFLVDFQLTEKTDVYSFGVVLVELLTRKKPQSKDGKSLTLMFQESIREGTLYELLDTEIVDESSKVVLQQAAELVSRCLAVPGTTRPSMVEVAQVLRRLQDQVPERSQPPHELELQDIGPTEIEMTTGYPTAQSQSDAASGTYTPSPRKNS